MKAEKNCPIFMPVLSILGANMNDYIKYYKDYLFYEEQDSILFKTLVDINHHGRAVIDIVLRPDIEKSKELKSKSEKIPFICLSALIDTGAPISMIRKGYEKELGLESFSGADYGVIGSESLKGENVNLSIHICNVFPNTGFLDICPLSHEWKKNEGEKFDFLIGWDVLRYCNLNYDGAKSKFILEFVGKPNVAQNVTS